jgi:hypothetical protein
LWPSQLAFDEGAFDQTHSESRLAFLQTHLVAEMVLRQALPVDRVDVEVVELLRLQAHVPLVVRTDHPPHPQALWKKDAQLMTALVSVETLV